MRSLETVGRDLKQAIKKLDKLFRRVKVRSEEGPRRETAARLSLRWQNIRQEELPHWGARTDWAGCRLVGAVRTQAVALMVAFVDSAPLRLAQKRKGDSIEDYPDCFQYSRRILEGLHTVNKFSQTSAYLAAPAAGADAARALFKAAMNYRHDIFNAGLKAELEALVRNSKAFKVVLENRRGGPPPATGAGGASTPGAGGGTPVPSGLGAEAPAGGAKASSSAHQHSQQAAGAGTGADSKPTGLGHGGEAAGAGPGGEELPPLPSGQQEAGAQPMVGGSWVAGGVGLTVSRRAWGLVETTSRGKAPAVGLRVTTCLARWLRGADIQMTLPFALVCRIWMLRRHHHRPALTGAAPLQAQGPTRCRRRALRRRMDGRPPPSIRRGRAAGAGRPGLPRGPASRAALRPHLWELAGAAAPLN
mgnify:CR=1 FL=1